MKKTNKKSSGSQKKKMKSMSTAKEATVAHTAGGEMPDPSARKGASRKDAREAFR